MDGVLVIDKPGGMTSHDVVARVRRAAGQRRVGHAGTLDPDATGVLVVALGRATRLMPYLQASRKEYTARAVLGRTTTTLDAAGEVVSEADASAIGRDEVDAALASFVGDIQQIPPMVSAVRVGGERLHVKARRGEVVERAPRPVTIHELELLDFVPGRDAEVAFRVVCSTGTYVRTLAADVGERLGVGAHLRTLRRVFSGRFGEADAHPLEAVVAAGEQGRLAELVLTPAEGMSDHPRRDVDAHEAAELGFGRSLAETGRPGPVAAVDADGRLVAVIQDEAGAARPRVVLLPAGGGGG